MENKPITFSTCLRCIQGRKVSCCSDPLSRLPVTLKDIAKIESLGVKMEDFIFPRVFSEEEVEGDGGWWENGFIKRKEGTFKLCLKRNKDMSCMFLEEGKGCKLGKDRPAFCKIYPFWLNEKGEVIYEDVEKDYCLLCIEDFPIKEGLGALGETEECIKEYFAEIKDDFINNKKKHEELVDRFLKEKKSED